MQILTMRENDGHVTELLNSLPGPLEILEAGCGRRWPHELKMQYRLTGVDTDAEALKARVEQRKDLDVAILGDIRTVDLPESSYDVVYCGWVLEHISGAERAMKNFARWLKPGGLMIVRVPDRDTLCGWITRMTPHWVHVGYYRYVLRLAWAGTPGHGPYPTYFDETISRRGVADFCAEHRLRLVELSFIDSWIRDQRPEQRAIARALAAATLGLVPWRWNAVTFVVQKPA